MNFDREMPLVLKKIPLVLKIIIGSIPIIVGIFYSYYSTSANVKNKEEFYKAEFSSVVIRSNTSEGRTTEFHLENNLKILELEEINENDIEILKKSLIDKNSEGLLSFF